MIVGCFVKRNIEREVLRIPLLVYLVFSITQGANATATGTSTVRMIPFKAWHPKGHLLSIFHNSYSFYHSKHHGLHSPGVAIRRDTSWDLFCMP